MLFLCNLLGWVLLAFRSVGLALPRAACLVWVSAFIQCPHEAMVMEPYTNHRTRYQFLPARVKEGSNSAGFFALFTRRSEIQLFEAISVVLIIRIVWRFF